MKKIKETVVVDYFLSPEEVESMKKEAKKPKFVLPLLESSENINSLLIRAASIYARFSAKDEASVDKRFEYFLNYFSHSTFENAVMSINEQIFSKYTDKSKRVEIDPPKNLESIELVVLKKALNKQGWLVQQTNYPHGKFNYINDWNYVLAPRKKELKTELNRNVKNMELAFDKSFQECYMDLPLSGFYRNNKYKK